MRAKVNLLNRINAILPVGPLAKNISFWRASKAAVIPFLNFRILLDGEVEAGIEANHPASSEGRFAIVTDVRRGAVDADGAVDDGAGCGRRRRVVLAPRRWR
jgi:hypothetical protein